MESRSSDTPSHSTFCLPCGGIVSLPDNNQVLLKVLSFGSDSRGESSVVKTDHSGSHVLGGGTTAGITMISIDPLSSQVIKKWSFPTGTSDEASQQLVQAVEGIPNGIVVAVAGCGDIVTHLSDEAKQALESVGSSQLRRIDKNNSWVLIGVRGAAPSSVCECSVGNAKESVCMLLQDIAQYQPTTGEHRHKRALFVLPLLLAGAVLTGICSIVTGIILHIQLHNTPCRIYSIS